VDDFWPEVAALGLEDPESDEDFVGEAGFDSEEEEEEDPESPEPLPAATLDADPDRLSVR
jgi:hypothetical protein